MEPVSEEKDRELKEELEDRYSIRYSNWGAGRADFPDRLTFYWPYDKEEQRERVERTAGLVETLGYQELYMVAFEREQYAWYKKNFEEKYDGRSAQIKASEIPQVAENLVEAMVLPKSLEWMILFDHEGDITFYGGEEFIEEVKDFFEDWEKLSEPPERRRKK